MNRHTPGPSTVDRKHPARTKRPVGKRQSKVVDLLLILLPVDQRGRPHAYPAGKVDSTPSANHQPPHQQPARSPSTYPAVLQTLSTTEELYLWLNVSPNWSADKTPP